MSEHDEVGARAGTPAGPREAPVRGGRNTFDVLMRAIASAESELELSDIRALAATHNAHRLESLDRAIGVRRRQLQDAEQLH